MILLPSSWTASSVKPPEPIGPPPGRTSSSSRPPRPSVAPEIEEVGEVIDVESRVETDVATFHSSIEVYRPQVIDGEYNW